MGVYDKKSDSQLKVIAQRHFNCYIRNRDMKDGYFICESCKKYKPLDQMQAGHFFSMGNYSYLRFNEDNVHGQCIACNCHLSGNLINYRINLINKIGEDRVIALENQRHVTKSWTRFELIEIIHKYKELNKEGVM